MIAHGQQFGPYRVERLLGRGGMGELYEAVDETGRRLALKVLTHGIDDAQDRARFLREGRLAGSISHPHTVYVYGTDEIEGVPVIAMELATGGSLKDRVRNEGPLAPAEAVDAILEVISGLEAAAAGGVLHRDVKPSNCFVDSEGRVKVGDFGLSISTLAKADRDLTLAGAFLGTPAFASPEQLRSDDLDVRSDIYSVGATLYYLLTGRPPFEEENILRLASTGNPEPTECLLPCRMALARLRPVRPRLTRVPSPTLTHHPGYAEWRPRWRVLPGFWREPAAPRRPRRRRSGGQGSKLSRPTDPSCQGRAGARPPAARRCCPTRADHGRAAQRRACAGQARAA
jgi:serine/threonine protein kinase